MFLLSITLAMMFSNVKFISKKYIKIIIKKILKFFSSSCTPFVEIPSFERIATFSSFCSNCDWPIKWCFFHRICLAADIWSYMLVGTSTKTIL